MNNRGHAQAGAARPTTKPSHSPKIMDSQIQDGQPPASAPAVGFGALLGCPWCGNQPVGHAMKYRNTGRVFGHKIRCETCNFERAITPPGWPEGKEQDVMDAAKVQLVEWWNSRKQPNVPDERRDELK